MGEIHQEHISSLEPVIDKLTNLISTGIEDGQSVLWLLSGGSAIPVAIEVAKRLKIDHGDRLNLLTVSLVDERYGPVDYMNSNWYQLIEGGFDAAPAKYEPVLKGLDFKETLADFDTTVDRLFRTNDLKIGLFGIGPDGHTAGILPDSVAVNVTDKLVAGYEGPDYERITITAPAIAKLEFAVTYAVGEAKIPAIKSLIESDIPPNMQPAQFLKQAKSLYIYSS